MKAIEQFRMGLISMSAGNRGSAQQSIPFCSPRVATYLATATCFSNYVEAKWRNPPRYPNQTAMNSLLIN